MLDIVDFLEPMIQGNWKYLGGFILGLFVLILLRYIRLLWIERQMVKDVEFIQSHQNIPIKTLQKKVWFILLSLVILVIVVLPVSMWITVEILKQIESIEPAFALLFLLVLFILILIISMIQAVRLRRLRRRIKKMSS
jgi:hypothetical protein